MSLATVSLLFSLCLCVSGLKCYKCAWYEDCAEEKSLGEVVECGSWNNEGCYTGFHDSATATGPVTRDCTVSCEIEGCWLEPWKECCCKTDLCNIQGQGKASDIMMNVVIVGLSCAIVLLM